MPKKLLVLIVCFTLFNCETKESKKARGLTAVERGDWNVAIKELEDYISDLERTSFNGKKPCLRGCEITGVEFEPEKGPLLVEIEEKAGDVINYLEASKGLISAYLGKAGFDIKKIIKGAIDASKSGRIGEGGVQTQAASAVTAFANQVFGGSTTPALNMSLLWVFKSARFFEYLLWGKEGYLDGAILSETDNRATFELTEQEAGSKKFKYKNLVKDIQFLSSFALVFRPISTAFTLNIVQQIEEMITSLSQVQKSTEEARQKQEQPSLPVSTLPPLCCHFPSTPPYNLGTTSPYTLKDIIYDLSSAAQMFLFAAGIAQETVTGIKNMQKDFDNIDSSFTNTVTQTCYSASVSFVNILTSSIDTGVTELLKKIGVEGVGDDTTEVKYIKNNKAEPFDTKLVGPDKDVWICMKGALQTGGKYSITEDVLCKTLLFDAELPDANKIKVKIDKPFTCEVPGDIAGSNECLLPCKDCKIVKEVFPGMVSDFTDQFNTFVETVTKTYTAATTIVATATQSINSVMNFLNALYADPLNCGISQ